MNFHAGTHLVVPLIGLLVMLSSAPLLVTAVQCPAESVVNENGSLIYRPLSPGSDIADPVYDPGVIGGWYSLAAGFVDVVRSGSLPYRMIMSSLTSLGVQCSISGSQECPTTDGQSSNFDPLSLLRSFVGWWAGIIALSVIGGILACSFLICGCCFWCCRCCGNCGGGKTQKLSDNMDCKSFTFTIILLLFTLLLLNEQTFSSLENFQNSINTVAETGVDYINDTIIELEELLCQLAAPMNSVASTVVNEAETFNTMLESEIGQVGNEVFGILENLNNLTAGINATSDVLSSVDASRMALTSSFGTLQISLSNVRMQTQSLISDCNSAAAVMSQLRATCDSIPRADDLQTEANFNNLPNVTDELDAVRVAIENVNLDELISEGQQQFDSIAETIRTTVDDNLGNVITQLENVTSTALNAVGDVTEAVRVYLNNSQDKANCPEIGEVFNNIDVNFNDLTSGSSSLDFSGGRRRRQTGGSQQQTLTVGYIQQCVINQAFDLVRQYDVYRYAFGIVICSISLVTILFVLLGVLFGMIGFRKNADPSDRSGLSHCGGIFLLIGVGLTFLFGFLLLVFSAIVFFFGANAQKVCQSLEGPEYPLFAELIDNQEFWGGSLGGQLFLTINPNATDAVLSFSVALRNCQDDMALYTALNLSNLLPTGSISSQIENLVNFSQVENLVDGLIEGAAESFNFTENSFLPDEARRAINDFVGANVSSINITEYNQLLNETLLAFDITVVIAQLSNVSTQLSNSSQSTLANDVDAIIMNLTDIQNNQIPLIQSQASSLSADVEQLSSVINTTVMNVSRILNTTNELIANITGQTLNGFLDQSVRGTVDRTIGYIEDYIIHLDNSVTRDVSRCQPLWAIYTTMHNSVCGMFLDGLNGFWWSLGFCSILFIPVIIFSVITSSCYLRKRSDEQLDSYSDYPMKDVR